MINFAQIFFYIHSSLCLAYCLMVARLSVGVLFSLVNSQTSRGFVEGNCLSMKGFSATVGNLYLINDDKLVNGIMYFILGLFLLYAEIYIYRIYSLSFILAP